MLGSALEHSWGQLKSIGTDIAKLNAWKKEYFQDIQNGIYPSLFEETGRDYLARKVMFVGGTGYYRYLNQKIQRLTLEMTLHAIFYDHDINKAVARVIEDKGYMPRQFIERLNTLMRSRMINEIKPYVITKEDTGKVDPDYPFTFNLANFMDVNAGKSWDMRGVSTDSTHFLMADSEKMIELIDNYIDKMKAKADEQGARIESGEIDKVEGEEDYTHLFDLNL
jgi:hypothetical protein